MFQVAIKKDLLSPDRGNAAGVNIDVNYSTIRINCLVQLNQQKQLALPLHVTCEKMSLPLHVTYE